MMVSWVATLARAVSLQGLCAGLCSLTWLVLSRRAAIPHFLVFLGVLKRTAWGLLVLRRRLLVLKRTSWSSSGLSKSLINAIIEFEMIPACREVNWISWEARSADARDHTCAAPALVISHITCCVTDFHIWSKTQKLSVAVYMQQEAFLMVLVSVSMDIKGIYGVLKKCTLLLRSTVLYNMYMYILYAIMIIIAIDHQSGQVVSLPGILQH